jgi:ATP-binding cassette subfamily G (WHITE) protein 2 (PDR)
MGYAFESLMVNEFYNRIFPCGLHVPGDLSEHPCWPKTSWVCDAVGATAGETFVNGTIYLELAFEYKHSHKWRNVGILFGFLFGLLAAYVFFSEFNESAKQNGEVLLLQRSTLKRL